MAGTTLHEVVAPLYRVPPDRFVAERAALAKRLKPTDAGAATTVSKLPKPTLPAWALDVLAHERPEGLDELLSVAAELRAAQEDSDRDGVRSLTAQAHQLVRRVVADTRQGAAEAGHPLGDQHGVLVEQTLRAAMADPAAAAVVRGGVLVKPLAPSGFGPVDLEGAVAVSPPPLPELARPARHLSAVPPGAADVRAAAKAALGRARAAHRAAQQRETRARRERETAERRRDEAEERVSRLRAELQEAAATLADAGTAAERAAAAHHDAEAFVLQTADAVREAQAALD